MQANPANVRKFIVLIIGLVVVGLLAHFLLYRCMVTIQLNKPGDILLVSEGKEYRKNNTSGGRFFVKPGLYTISAVDDDKNRSFALFDAKALRKKSLLINISAQQKNYVVSEAPLKDIQKIGEGSFIGLDITSGFVKLIDQGITSSIELSGESEEPTSYKSIGKLANNYFLVSGQGAPLLINGATKTAQIINDRSGDTAKVSVNSDTESFWLISAKQARLYEQPYAKPSKTVAIDNLQQSSVASTKDRLLFFPSAETVDDNPDDTETHSDVLKPYIVNVASGDKKTLDINIVTAGWSPDGTKLAFIGARDKFLAIYDVAKHKVTSLVNQPDSVNFYWKDKQLFYSQENAVWSYDTTKGYSKLITITQNSPNSLTLSNGFYATTYPNEANAKVYSIGPRNNSSLLARLSAKLPIEQSDYRISYTYLGVPVITVELRVPNNGTSPGRVALYNQRSAAAKQAALVDISKSGIQQNEVLIKFSE